VKGKSKRSPGGDWRSGCKTTSEQNIIGEPDQTLVKTHLPRPGKGEKVADRQKKRREAGFGCKITRFSGRLTHKVGRRSWEATTWSELRSDKETTTTRREREMEIALKDIRAFALQVSPSPNSGMGA